MRPSAQLAQLLGCTVDELRADLQRLVRESSAETVEVPRVRREACSAIIGDGNFCERAHGHAGLHVHIAQVWEGRHAFTGRVRCSAVSPTSRGLRTSRCVLELGHEAAHQLDDGSVFFSEGGS